MPIMSVPIRKKKRALNVISPRDIFHTLKRRSDALMVARTLSCLLLNMVPHLEERSYRGKNHDTGVQTRGDVETMGGVGSKQPVTGDDGPQRVTDSAGAL